MRDEDYDDDEPLYGRDEEDDEPPPMTRDELEDERAAMRDQDTRAAWASRGERCPW